MLVGYLSLLWGYGYLRHKADFPFPQDWVYLPRWINVLCGSFRSDNRLSIRGILAQLIVYTIGPILLLLVLDIISINRAVYWLGGVSAGLLVLIVVLEKIRK
jgi:hypothetical protein